MTEASHSASDSLIPQQPIPAELVAFSKQVSTLLDGKPKDEATVAKALEGMDDAFDMIAAGMYNLASMLVGEGEESVRLVETAVTNAEVSACHEAAQARKSGRRVLCSEAIALLEQRAPGCLAAPDEAVPAAGCIEDDDLDAAGVSGEELETMMAGPDRDRVKAWLESLSTPERVIFVLRAVAGFSAADTAEMLAANGGAKAAGWTREAVRENFRQGLCSLASQLIHASTNK